MPCCGIVARESMICSRDHSRRIRTYDVPENECTDHRINLTLYSLDALIAAIQPHDNAQRPANL